MYKLQPEEISKLTSLVLAATLNPSKWKDFLGHISVTKAKMQAKDCRNFDQSWAKLLSLLTPNLNQAVEINYMFAGKSLEIFELENAENHANIAVCIIDRNFLLRFCNPNAIKLLDCGSLVRTDQQNRISFECSNANALLKGSVSECTRPETPRSVYTDVICSKSQKVFSVRIVAIEPNILGYELIGDSKLIQTTGVSISICERESFAYYKTRVQELFKLTEAEVEVVAALSCGRSLNAISDSRQVSIHTIRNQLKAAMSKMDARRQSDVVRIFGMLHHNIYTES